jgi:hypothetical protein
MKAEGRLALVSALLTFAIIVGWELAPGWRALVGLPGGDFAAYYGAALALRSGTHPYDLAVTAQLAAHAGCYVSTSYVYPPFLALVFIPLSYLPCGAAMMLWQIVSAACLALSLWLLQVLWPMSRPTFLVLCAVTVFCVPVLTGIYWGQVHLLLLAGVLVALWRSEVGDPIAAGAIIACMAWIQLLPGLVVIYWMFKRQWKVVAVALITGGIVLALMLLIAGPAVCGQWIVGLLHAFPDRRQTYNVSPLYQFGEWIAVPLLSLYLIGSRVARDVRKGYLWTLTTMIVLSPVAYQFMFTWLIPTAWVHLASRKLLLVASVLVVDIMAFGPSWTLSILLVVVWFLQSPYLQFLQSISKARARSQR